MNARQLVIKEARRYVDTAGRHVDLADALVHSHDALVLCLATDGGDDFSLLVDYGRDRARIVGELAAEDFYSLQ